MARPPSIRASVLKGYRGFAIRRGLDVRALLAAAHLSPADLDEPNSAQMLRMSDVARLLELSARKVGDPDFGLHYAEQFPKGATGLYGHIALTAPTVRDMLRNFERFVDLWFAFMPVSYDERGGHGRLSWTYPPPLRGPAVQLSTFLATLVVLRIRLAAGAGWMPQTAEFPFRQPNELSELRRMFGSGLAFNAPRHAIGVGGETLALAVPQAIEGLHQTVRTQGERELERLRAAGEPLVELRRLLEIRLEAGKSVSLEQLAHELGVPVRTLQWRLKRTGESYETLLQDVRSGRAEQLLRDTAMPIARIASAVGFADAGAFNRWVRRHYDTTPGRLRERLRRDRSVDGAAVRPRRRDARRQPALGPGGHSRGKG